MIMTQIVNEFLCSANMAFAMYPGLTQGAIAALIAHGSAEQKAAYLPKMIAGEWTGTMNLTEPHCGTDLGLLRTKAAKQPDGSYKITGTKIFISAGEHDLAANIIHLVLARIEGAPEGTRGHFAVRRAEDAAEARRLARRAQRAWRAARSKRRWASTATSTCVMNYDGATGWLLGEENRGLPRHVHDDERGAARRRRAGARAVRGRLSERRRLRQGTPAGPRAHRREIQGQAGRSDHRASRRAPHADDDQVVQRGGARAGGVDRARLRSPPSLRGREDPPGGRRPHGPAHAGDQRRAHRHRASPTP